MKRPLLLFALWSILSTSVSAQSTTVGPVAGHIGALPAIDYLGWSNAIIPLYFRTNYGVAPAGAGNRMIITDGGLIQVVDLDQRGSGQINVFADDLSNGIYSYALVVDSKVVDTKQMVKAK